VTWTPDQDGTQKKWVIRQIYHLQRFQRGQGQLNIDSGIFIFGHWQEILELELWADWG